PSVRPMLLGIVAVVGASYWLGDAVGASLPVPTWGWMIPRTWSRFGHYSMSFGFGFMLGTGIATIVSYIGLYVLMVGCMLTRSPMTSAALMATFGLMRGVPSMVAARYYSRTSANREKAYVEARLLLRRAVVPPAWVASAAILACSMVSMELLFSHR
ncbi:MAG: hypothetical protein ACRD3J_31160, partial [Thermoanaerobaculia bacterium]